MKNIIKSLLLLLSISIIGNITSYAQGDMENIRKLKIEIVLKEMDLKPHSEKQFLPLFNKYSDEALVIKKKIKALEHNKMAPEAKIKEREQLKQELLNIEKKYKQEFLKVISPDELEKMYKGEDKFRKTLLELKK
jgi:hypothetical protein